MTWLKGQSTWANICDDIAKLACGEIADDTATTCAVGDRWARDISTSFNLIRSNASEDVNTGTVYNRAGYFSLMSSIYAGVSVVPPNVTAGYTPCKGVLKQTVVWSGVPTGVSNNRWMMLAQVITANTTPSNYSTARLSVQIWDPDTNLIVGAANTTAVPSSGGDITYTFGTKTITVNVSDPSNTLVVGTIWIRGFTSVYLGGIDWFGGYWPRRSGNATFSINPPGSAGTDYDVDIEIATGQNAIGSITNYSGVNIPQGGPYGGVGIKTNAGLTGARYACSWNLAMMKMRMVPQSGASNGQITLEVFGGGRSDSGTFRRTGGYTIAQWLRPYATPGSVTPGSLIQYWMSVKPKKITIILNADPGQTGVLTTAGVYPYTTYNYGGWDPLPMLASRTVQQGSTNAVGGGMVHQAQYLISQMRVRLDGSEGSRDWQTRWMRTDFGVITRASDGTFGHSDPMALSSGSANGYSTVVNLSSVGPDNSNTPSSLNTSMPRTSSKPSTYTGKWAMYGFAILDFWTGTSSAYEYALPRGYIDGAITSPFLFIPGGLWASGDELTDSVSGAKWFLTNSVYSGLGAYYDAGVGGIAILEE